MRVFFAGDFVDPNGDIDYSCINEFIQDSDLLICNLEGPILSENERIQNNKHKFNLYSKPDFIENFKNTNLIFSLANNHINDFKNGLQVTEKYLVEKGIPYFGTAKKPFFEFDLNGIKTCVFSFNSSLTLPYSSKNVSTISKKNKDDILKYKMRNPDSILIAFVHFGLELNTYPTPADRKWCVDIANAGADYIIGHHPHIVHGVEKLNSAKVFYSIGNFVLPQTKYIDKTLSYNDSRVSKGIIVEIKSKTDFEIHKIELKSNQTSLKYLGKVNFAELQIDDKISHYNSFYLKNVKGPFYYPVFYDYYGIKFILKYRVVRSIQFFRNLLIRLGLYNPYK